MSQGDEGVVVTGLGVLCSIASGVDTLGPALRRGQNGIVDLGSGTGTSSPRFGAELRGFDFAPHLERQRPSLGRRASSALRLARRSPRPLQAAVVTALEAWGMAALDRRPIAGYRLALVVAGHNLDRRVVLDAQAKYEEHPTYVPGRFALSGLDSDHVGTLSEILGITGEGFTVGGASASGNLGLVHGSRAIEVGAADACLVVGAMSDLTGLERQAFFNLGAMAGKRPEDRAATVCRPFDRAHDGFVAGQGCGCVVLERETSARRRGVPILAGLAGYALGLDANSLADPRVEGEVRVMVGALRRAGLEPAQIDYVNAHGSASPLGDATEAKALRQVFDGTGGHPWINSTKGLLGHCLSAAGVIEAVATIVQMRRGFVHPNRNLDAAIDGGCRFVGARAEPAKIDAALSNSFGFGGIETSIVLTGGPGG